MNCLPSYESGHFRLVLQTGHVHFSAREIYRLFDEYLNILVNGNPTESPSELVNMHKLPLQVEDILPIAVSQSEREKAVARHWVSTLSDADPMALPKTGQHAEEAARTLRSAVTIDQRTTSQVIEACRQKKITVAAAWVAAMTLAFAEVIRETSGTSLTSNAALAGMTTLDSRSFAIDQPPSTNEPLVCSRIALAPIKLPANASFQQIATMAMDMYHGSGTLPEKCAAIPSITQQLLEAIYKRPELCSVIPSSYGIVDKYVNHQYGCRGRFVKVDDIWIAVATMNETVLMMLHTWKQRMILSSSYNAAFYSETMISDTLERVRDIFLQNLNVYPN